MVDLDILDEYDVTPEKLKEKLGKPRASRSERANKLVDHIKNRIRGGRDENFEKYPIYRALDLAWESAFNQITPTLLASLCDKNVSEQSVLDTLKAYNIDLNDVVQTVKDPKTGKDIQKISVPAFFAITVPLVMAYVKIRWAKLSNDKRNIPLFKFDPIISDAISRLRGEVITSTIEVQSNQYGYFDVMKQCIYRMLHYAECWQFPVEEWHCEYAELPESAVGEDKQFQEVDDEELQKDAEHGKVVITKEGLRYHLPHPSRTYFDRSFFPSTANSDTGVSYAGYWKIITFAEILRNKDKYWNIEQIDYNDFFSWFVKRKSDTYWANALRGCTINFPGEEVVSRGTLDAEAHIARYYSGSEADRPILVTEHFEKLVPKDWDLGDYPFPIWMRFSLAADDTLIYAAPVGYRPTTWWGYDFAEGRTHNASMSLEVLPFQDQYSNLFAQHLLTIRQNLANATLVDTDILNEEDIKKLDNFGEKMWRKINLIRTSFKKMFEKQRVTQATGLNPMIHMKFPFQDANGILQGMRMTIDMLERILVMSAQEVGQAASHEQTREELRHIQTNTTTRVVFTAVAVDIAIDAWKKQLYDAKMAYGSKSFYAQVPMDTATQMDAKKMEKLGFTYKSDYDKESKKVVVKVNDKTAIQYESFVSSREGDDRVNDVETGKNIIMLLTQIANNPAMFAAIGADQMIMWINYATRFLGFPRDFKLINTGQTQDFQTQVKDALQQLSQQTAQAIQGLKTDIQGSLQQIMQKNQQQDKGLAEVSRNIKNLFDFVKGGETPMPPEPSQYDNLPDNTGVGAIESYRNGTPATSADVEQATVG